LHIIPAAILDSGSDADAKEFALAHSAPPASLAPSEKLKQPDSVLSLPELLQTVRAIESVNASREANDTRCMYLTRKSSQLPAVNLQPLYCRGLHFLRPSPNGSASASLGQ